MKQSVNDDNYDLVEAEEVAKILKVSARTVNERYAYKKGFPKSIKEGQKRLWRRKDIHAYLDEKFKAA